MWDTKLSNDQKTSLVGSVSLWYVGYGGFRDRRRHDLDKMRFRYAKNTEIVQSFIIKTHRDVRDLKKLVLAAYMQQILRLNVGANPILREALRHSLNTPPSAPPTSLHKYRNTTSLTHYHFPPLFPPLSQIS